MIVGLALTPLLTIQLYPSSSSYSFSVSYSWPDVSAKVIEQEVTSKLEGLFSSVKGMENISSISAKGYGRINLTFKETTNRDAMRFEIAMLIRQSFPDLPVGVSYPNISIGVSGERASPVLTYTITGNSSAPLIKMYAEKNILPTLANIENVSEVQFFGATPYEVEIQFQVEKVRALGLTGDEIADAVNTRFRQELVGRGIYKQAGNNDLKDISIEIQHNSMDPAVWEKIPIRKINGRIIYLTDLATIRQKEETPSTFYRINGLNAVNIVIYSKRDINLLSLAREVRSEMEKLQESLAANYSILLANDTTEFLWNEINKIVVRIVISLIILLLVVLIVTRNLRYLLIILISFISNCLLSCILFYLLDVELQLYSFAAIPVAFGIVIGNSIIMVDHLSRNRNKKIFLAILASTIATIISLGAIFFLPEQQKFSLLNFSLVLMINLAVCFPVSFYFIPALMEKVQLQIKTNGRKRVLVKGITLYGKSILFNRRFKWVYIVLLVIGFGIPVHLLPKQIEHDAKWASLYNNTLGDEYFLDEIKPLLEKILGGSLRLFAKDVLGKSYHREPSKTTLYIRGSMPEGGTVHHLNQAVAIMENFISQFDEVKIFQTTVSSYRNSEIAIQFKPEYEFTDFPLRLKTEIEGKAVSIGGVTWSVYGVGQGFSNAIHDGGRNNGIVLEGYNYDELYKYSEVLRQKLLENPRVKDVQISSERWNTDVATEFFIDFNDRQLALNEVSTAEFYVFLKESAFRQQLNAVYSNQQMYNLYLTSDKHSSFSAWSFNNDPLKLGDKVLKMGFSSAIQERRSGNSIHKSNQQYKLTVSYDFTGPYDLSEIIQKQLIEETESTLPVGYSIAPDTAPQWNKDEETQYLYIIIIIIAIYCISVIFLESLLQPLAIVLMIPLSFIGSFLAYYIFDINFDQGGFASFILLCGLSVGTALYIVNDYNNFRMQRVGGNFDLYMKSFNSKFVPNTLAITSIILSLTPFLIDPQRDVFWFPFAIGTIGGLVFSVIGILIYLPLFLPLSKDPYSNVPKLA